MPSKIVRRKIPAIQVSCLLATLLLTPGPAVAQGPVPILCDGTAYIVQENDPGKLFRFLREVPEEFAFQATGTQLVAGEICDPGEACNLMVGGTEVEANNLAFRNTAAGGFLYAVWLTAAGTNMGIIRIDDIDASVTVTPLGIPGGLSFPTDRPDAGDISTDGDRMYINTIGSGQLTIVDLNSFEVVAQPNIVGDTGRVNDWAYNPRDGNLYGGDREGGEVARLRLAVFEAGGDVGDITREDLPVLGCQPVDSECNATELPSVGVGPAFAFGAYGGSWFTSEGDLFVFRNSCEFNSGSDPCPDQDMTPCCPTPPCDPATFGPECRHCDGTTSDCFPRNGKLYEINLNLASPDDPRIVKTQIGRNSEGFNDSTACIVIPPIGAAKGMTATCGLPSTVTIEYRFENFASINDTLTIVNNLSAMDDLTAVFGTHGVDWTFTSISLTSGPAGFANAAFNGHTDTELINQAPTQSLGPGESAEITVEIEVLTLANASGPPDFPPGTFCNQVRLTGINELDIPIGDVSTQLEVPFDPDESLLSCVTLADPAVTLVKTGAFDDGGDGADPGDLINYTFTVSNPANVGAVQLDNLLVSDPLVSPITCPSGNPIPMMLPGGMETCTGSYAITQADIDAMTVTNTATVSGTPFLPDPPFPPPFGDSCPPVDDTDDHLEPIMGPEPPCLDLVKSCDPDLGPDGLAEPGEVIDYEFVVSNCGDVQLIDVFIDDPMVTVDCSPLVNGAITLDPMASATCAGTYVITQADIDAGEKCNMATATGNVPGGPPVESPLAESCCELPIFVIPTLGHLGLLLLALGLAGLGLRQLRRRR